MHALIVWIIFHNNILFIIIIIMKCTPRRARHVQMLFKYYTCFLCQDITEIGLLNPSHGKQLRPFRTIIKARRHILSEWYEIPRCNVALCMRDARITRRYLFVHICVGVHFYFLDPLCHYHHHASSILSENRESSFRLVFLSGIESCIKDARLKTRGPSSRYTLRSTIEKWRSLRVSRCFYRWFLPSSLWSVAV